MTNAKPRLLKAERDRIVIDAIKRARNAMMLLHGTRVTFGRRSAYLEFEKEVLKLNAALRVLGLDPGAPLIREECRYAVGSRRAVSRPN